MLRFAVAAGPLAALIALAPPAPAMAATCPAGQVMQGTRCVPIGQTRLPTAGTSGLSTARSGAAGLPNAEITRRNLRAAEAAQKAQQQLRKLQQPAKP